MPALRPTTSADGRGAVGKRWAQPRKRSYSPLPARSLDITPRVCRCDRPLPGVEGCAKCGRHIEGK
jgi:hypothetical protein